MKFLSTGYKAVVFILALNFSVSSLAKIMEPEPFTKDRFDKLQREDALILVDVSATSCATCVRQQEIIKSYRQDRKDLEVFRLTIDYNSQKEWVEFFRAPYQSTLILYSGTNQLWFSVAETHKKTIFRALNFAQLFHQ